MKKKQQKKRVTSSEESLGSMAALFNAAGFESNSDSSENDLNENEEKQPKDEAQHNVSPTVTRYHTRRERKGRGGKTVTIVYGLNLKRPLLETLAKDMKKSLGCGASIENDQIVLQGDIEKRVRDWLSSTSQKK